ncbi:C-terminal domain of CinA type S; Protein Implicated in DNA repair function with RecA and MutS [Pseudoalteromonas luteoviolacea B = ATCC 29581]|nr:C-terminal domain of CinA type S; Protein Implicated in DNA repair function with RecA and MutS [Pseudoalteromonas luteoviolacea B = ATCC 29581]
MNLHQEITTLAAQVGAILSDKGLTITTIESCTGGGISYALTDTPGSSAYIEQCFVTYSNTAKSELAAVNLSTLNEHGAVSEAVVGEMVVGGAKRAKADIAIAVSGIAGPGGGTKDKPVGLVWFAWKVLDKTVCKKSVFAGSRAEIRAQAIAFALKNLLVQLNPEN